MCDIHIPGLVKKKGTECEELFDTENGMKKHLKKYHVTNNNTPKVLNNELSE